MLNTDDDDNIAIKTKDEDDHYESMMNKLNSLTETATSDGSSAMAAGHLNLLDKDFRGLTSEAVTILGKDITVSCTFKRHSSSTTLVCHCVNKCISKYRYTYNQENYIFPVVGTFFICYLPNCFQLFFVATQV